MTMKKNARIQAVLVGTWLTASLALGADTPTKTISARGLSFEAPLTWKSTPPATPMRLAQLTIEPVKPDRDPTELQVFAFPGGAGSVDANIKRWQAQFETKAGKPPEVTTEKRKGKNVDVTFVEVAGTYVAAVSPGSDQKHNKPEYHLLGAIVETPTIAYFLKMVGPDRTVKAAKPAFDDLIKSMSVEAAP
jgi:hypothetical protein